MDYLSFERAFKNYPVFSIKDIIKRFPNFDNRRLVEWQKKDYLLNIRRGYYCFGDMERNERFLHFVANKIWSPSYVSLESALSFYNFIPEGVFLTSSITTRNTATYSTPLGRFEYRSVKASLFFGYSLIQHDGYAIKVAEPEKLFLDFFYSKKLDSLDEIEAMRFNVIQIKEALDFQKLTQYQQLFASKVLDKRIRLFLKVINA